MLSAHVCWRAGVPEMDGRRCRWAVGASLLGGCGGLERRRIGWHLDFSLNTVGGLMLGTAWSEEGMDGWFIGCR